MPARRRYPPNRSKPHDSSEAVRLPYSTAPPVAVHKLLTGQKALVTGANSGIGQGVAIALGQAGPTSSSTMSTATLPPTPWWTRSGNPAPGPMRYKADVSSEDQVAAMFARMMQEFGTIDILVNNAGLQRDSAFKDMTLAQWNTVLGVNLTGSSSARAKRFASSCGGGRAFGLVRGRQDHLHEFGHQEIPWGGHANYATSKGGIKLLMESMAQELAPQRIRVNAIAPGAIRTPINTSAWNTKEAYDALMTLVPYGRIGEPEDIARAAVWLASDHSDYVVGTTLFVDGGMTLYPGFATGG